MTDSWEDWDDDNYIVPILNIPNEEQLKRLEERRLVEESDNVFAHELFEDNNIVKQTEIKSIQKQLPSTEKKAPKKNIYSKQKDNEQKQKEASKANKILKEMKKRERDIFGEADEDDEYADYEDKYY